MDIRGSQAAGGARPRKTGSDTEKAVSSKASGLNNLKSVGRGSRSVPQSEFSSGAAATAQTWQSCPAL